MGLHYKIKPLETLINAGYTTYKLRNDRILSESTVQKLRRSAPVSWENLETICRLLNCQPGDVLEYVPDGTPNAKTLAAFDELDNGGGTHFSGSTDELFDEILGGDDA